MSLSTTTNTSGRTPEQDAVICALIGLARAAEAKEIPAGTAPVLFAALASVAPGGSLSSSAANDLVEQIHRQKSIVSPDCAACPSPCGRTADFLPKDLNCTDNGLFEDRNRLLAELSQHAKEEWKRILAEQEIRRSHDSLWTACSWRDMHMKRSCLRRILKNWRH